VKSDAFDAVVGGVKAPPKQDDAPTDDQTSDSGSSGGGAKQGVVQWLTFAGQGLALWTVDGNQLPGAYRAQGKQGGATGRQQYAGNEMMCEFVIDDTVAWMPESWWQMYFDSAYPTEAPVPDDTTVDTGQSDDLMEQLESMLDPAFWQSYDSDE